MKTLIRALATLAAVALCLVITGTASADAPKRGLLVLMADHLEPGQPFTLVGSRIDPGATLALRLEGETRTLALGDASVAQDGTISATFDLPADFPLGDAWIRGRTTTGVDLELYVHVGPRAEFPGASGNPGVSATPLDDRVFGLILAGVGTVLFLIAAAWYVRSRPRGTPTG